MDGNKEGRMMELSMYLALAALISIAGVYFLWNRRFTGRNNSPLLNQNEIDPLGAHHVGFNPIRSMNFDDFQNPESFNDGVKREVSVWINGNTAMIGLQASALIEFKGTILTSFSPEVAQKISGGVAELMKTSKGLQPTAIAKNGQILENAHKIDPSTAAQLAQVVPVIVGAAHLIAGYDNAKKLAQVESKLDKLIGFHRAYQVAELKTIFEDVQKCWFDSRQIEAQKTKLKSLRNRVTIELIDDLNRIPAFNQRGALSRKLTPKKTTKSVAQALQPIPFLRSITQLEQMVHMALNQSEGYLKHEYLQTIDGFMKINVLTKSKIDGIPEKDAAELREFVSVLASLYIEGKKAA